MPQPQTPTSNAKVLDDYYAAYFRVQEKVLALPFDEAHSAVALIHDRLARAVSVELQAPAPGSTEPRTWEKELDDLVHSLRAFPEGLDRMFAEKAASTLEYVVEKTALARPKIPEES